MSVRDEIEQLLAAGRAAEAQADAKQALARHPDDAGLHYLLGKACLKTGDWQGALNAFLEAERIDPDSPAVQSRQMVQEILDFYCKDYYNP